MDRARKKPSPDPGRKTGNTGNVTAKTDLKTALARSNFTEDDKKSKNILAWAGRVKELIGTYDSGHGHEAGMGQLTRATGYSDLLAACGVDSGDVKTNTIWPMTNQTSSTKLENCGANYNLPKPTTSPVVKQSVAEKEHAGHSAIITDDNQTKQNNWSRSMSSTMPRTEDQSHRADRQEIRRASSSQSRVKPDHPDVSQKPPARRASQTEVKPTATRDSSRSPDARPQLRRSSVEKLNSTTERTSTTGRNAPSSNNGRQHQPRKGVSPRNSKETLAAPTAVSSFKLNQTNEEAQKYSNKEATDVTKGPPSGGAVASRRSYEPDAERSMPTIRNSSRLNAEDCDDYSVHRQRTSNPDDVDPTDNDEITSKRVRAADRDHYPQEAKVSRLSKTEPTDSMESRPQKASNRDVERYKHESRVSRPSEVEGKNSIESLTQRLSDLDMRRRAEYPSSQAPSQRVPDMSRLDDVEPANNAELRRRGVRDRDFENRRHEQRVSRQIRVEEKDSEESLSRRVSDDDVRRRADYPSPARLQREHPSSKRVPDSSRLTGAEPTNNAALRSRRVRNSDLENRQHEQRVSRQIDVEEKDSEEYLSQRQIDVDVKRRDEYSSPAGLQNRLPSKRVPDMSPARDTRRDSQDPTMKREQTSPVRSRRRLMSESGSNRPRQGARDGATSLPPPTSAGREAKPRTPSAGPPSPRPILRKPSPQRGMKESVTTEKGKKVIPQSHQSRPSSLQPAIRARPAVVPLRRIAAAVAATGADEYDEDDDDDDDDDIVVTPRHTGRGLGKSTAVTDLSDDLGVSHRITSDKRYQGHSQLPNQTASMTSLHSSSSLTPRRIWEFMHPCVRRLLTCLMGFTGQMLYGLLRLPQVVEAGQNVRVAWLRVMDDWALFTAVMFAVACIFVVIMLS